MARKTNKELVLTLADALGVEVEYGQMGEDGFEVALYGYTGHMAFDPMGEGHTAITNQAGTGARTESRIWGMALADLKEFVPCGDDCHCRTTADADLVLTDEDDAPRVAPIVTDADGFPIVSTLPFVIDSTLYVAGWNMPGYLPECDAYVFETESEATRFLIDEIDRFWDQDYLGDELREVADSRWMDIHASLIYETAPYSVQNGDGSLTFWVAIVPRSDVLTFDSEGN